MMIRRNKNYRRKRITGTGGISEPVLSIEYSYDTREADRLGPALDAFEREVGGERQPFGMRGGAVNLFAVLEIVVTFIAGATLGQVITSYFGGLIGADKAKELGDRHRKKITQWLSSVQQSLSRLVDSARRRFHEGLTAPLFQDKEQPIAIRIDPPPIECFIVLNHSGISDDTLNGLPAAIIRMLRFIAESDLPEQTTVLQLCLDPATSDWRFLLVPSHRAFGRFVDRIIDLATGEVINVSSADQFIELLGVEEREGLKYLIDPYRYMDRE